MGPFSQWQKVNFHNFMFKNSQLHFILHFDLKRQFSKVNLKIKTLQGERTLNFYLKENICFVPHLKAVQYCFPISQNIKNVPNVDGPFTLSLKGM